jgi:hypothetical protein
MNTDFDTVLYIVLFVCGALLLCTAAILVYALIIALELRQERKTLKDHPNVVREWPLKNRR